MLIKYRRKVKKGAFWALICIYADNLSVVKYHWKFTRLGGYTTTKRCPSFDLPKHIPTVDVVECVATSTTISFVYSGTTHRASFSYTLFLLNECAPSPPSFGKVVDGSSLSLHPLLHTPTFICNEGLLYIKFCNFQDMCIRIWLSLPNVDILP